MLDRAAEVGNTISITVPTASFAGTLPPPLPALPFNLLAGTVDLNESSGQITNVVQNMSDPGYNSAHPSSFVSGNFTLSSYFKLVLPGGTTIYSDPNNAAVFTASLTGLPAPLGTVFSSPDRINLYLELGVKPESFDRPDHRPELRPDRDRRLGARAVVDRAVVHRHGRGGDDRPRPQVHVSHDEFGLSGSEHRSRALNVWIAYTPPEAPASEWSLGMHSLALRACIKLYAIQALRTRPGIASGFAVAGSSVQRGSPDPADRPDRRSPVFGAARISKAFVPSSTLRRRETCGPAPGGVWRPSSNKRQPEIWNFPDPFLSALGQVRDQREPCLQFRHSRTLIEIA